MCKYKPKVHIIIGILLCSAIFTGIFYMQSTTTKNNAIMVSADESGKKLKWTKQIIEEGTTIDVNYLWPNEENASIEAVYRDGKLLSEDKMITITSGNVYHFRGISDDSVLYTEVYVGNTKTIDVTTGETGTWYQLLPSEIRNDFEESGWIWETGWEYTGRAYLDSENKRVMLKDNDYTAVLYGMGLYLDNKYNYVDDAAFIQEGEEFQNTFDSTDNTFASALEYYHTKGGELYSKCPKIYAMIAEILSQLNDETAQIRQNTITAEEPVLMTDLLEYVNIQREQVGLQPVLWDSTNNDNVIERVKYHFNHEDSILNVHIIPDIYTKNVKYELFFDNANTIEDIFYLNTDYFFIEELTSFNCAIYNNVGVIIFTW